MAVVAIPWLVPVTTSLSDTRDAVVEAIGVHVFLVIVLLVWLGWLIIRRSLLPSLYLYWRRWLVGALLAGFVMGVAGLFRPDWRLGGTALSDVTAGGEWGHALVASPLGILGWLGLGFAAVTVVWPRGVLRLLRRSPRLTVVVWRWHVPQRSWRFARTVGGSLFPTKVEPEPPAPLSMDTLMWARTSSAPAGEAGVGEAGTAVIAEETSEPAVQPWQPSLPLAMGSDEEPAEAAPPPQSEAG